MKHCEQTGKSWFFWAVGQIMLMACFDFFPPPADITRQSEMSTIVEEPSSSSSPSSFFFFFHCEEKFLSPSQMDPEKANSGRAALLLISWPALPKTVLAEIGFCTLGLVKAASMSLYLAKNEYHRHGCHRCFFMQKWIQPAWISSASLYLAKINTTCVDVIGVSLPCKN